MWGQGLPFPSEEGDSSLFPSLAAQATGENGDGCVACEQAFCDSRLFWGSLSPWGICESEGFPDPVDRAELLSQETEYVA